MVISSFERGVSCGVSTVRTWLADLEYFPTQRCGGGTDAEAGRW